MTLIAPPKNRAIHQIVVHCSDSEWGDAAVIDAWHRERGWSGIGYHAVVLNGTREPYDLVLAHLADEGLRPPVGYRAENDGLIEPGRDVEAPGAHVKGHNRHTLGVCLIGTRFFTGPQLEALGRQVAHWLDGLDLWHSDGASRYAPAVVAHADLDTAGKTCPNLSTEFLCRLVTSYRNGGGEGV